MLCFKFGFNLWSKPLRFYKEAWYFHQKKYTFFKSHFVRAFSEGLTKTKSDLRVLFLGSDDFSICSLEAVLRVFPAASVTVVVSNENNLVAKFAKRNDIQLCLWDSIKKATVTNQKDASESNTVATSASTDLKFHLGVVSSFGHLIPDRIIRACQMGILNVHGSLLPKWRGAAPIAHAIMNGDAITGISIMKIAPYRFDIGPVLYQDSVPIHPHIRTPELTKLLASLGSNALELVLQNLDTYLDKALPQNEKESTLSPKITQEMSHVQWESQSAQTIYNLYRGLSGIFKLKTNYMGKPVDLDSIALYSSSQVMSSTKTSNHLVKPGPISKETDFGAYYTDSPVLVHVKELPNSAQLLPGHIHYTDNVLCVKCTGQDAEDLKQNWIFIRKVKIGTKWMSAKDFRNGFLTKPLAATCFDSIEPMTELIKSRQESEKQDIN